MLRSLIVNQIYNQHRSSLPTTTVSKIMRVTKLSLAALCGGSTTAASAAFISPSPRSSITTLTSHPSRKTPYYHHPQWTPTTPRLASTLTTPTSSLRQSLSTVTVEDDITESNDDAAAVATPASTATSAAELLSFTPGSHYGWAAVRLMDDAIGDGLRGGSTTADGAPRLFGPVTGGAAAAGGAAVVKAKDSSQGDDVTGRQVTFTDTATGDVFTGVVVAQRPPIAFVLTHTPTLPSSLDIHVTTTRVTIPTFSGDNQPSVVDAQGQPRLSTSTTPSSSSSSERILFAPIPKVSEISLINTPLLTGITAVDTLSPIGKGQNMLLFSPAAHTSTHARPLLWDTVATQCAKGTRCLYAVTDPRRLDSVRAGLKERGVEESVTVVSVTSDDNPAEAVACAAAACAIAEGVAREEGGDALVVIDDLAGHKALWESTTRTLLDVYGETAVVQADVNGGASSEMRAFYSGLIQRSAKFKNGGSVTLVLLQTLWDDEPEGGEVTYQREDFDGMSEKIKSRLDILLSKNIPLTAANLRKIQIPIPSKTDASNTYRLSLQHADDLISMSDGQIWLSPSATSPFNPPLDPTRSITRVGVGRDTDSRADAPALRGLIGALRFDLAQAVDESNYSGNEKDKWRLRREGMIAALSQGYGRPRSLGETVVRILAARVAGEAIGAAMVEDVQCLEELWGVVKGDDACGVVLKEIEAGEELSEEGWGILESVIKGFFNNDNEEE